MHFFDPLPHVYIFTQTPLLNFLTTFAQTSYMYMPPVIVLPFVPFLCSNFDVVQIYISVVPLFERITLIILVFVSVSLKIW